MAEPESSISFFSEAEAIEGADLYMDNKNRLGFIIKLHKMWSVCYVMIEMANFSFLKIFWMINHMLFSDVL